VKKHEIETRLESCLLTQDADMVEVGVNLRGPDIIDPVTKKATRGTGEGREVFRLRPVTETERAKARREASTSRQTVSLGADGSRSVSQELNAELYNSALLFYALGGERVFGSGESKEGWSLKDKAGDPLPVSLDNVRANVHPGIVSQLVDLVIGQNDISPASEKN